MKEQLQQIQAVAIVTFLCVLISIHSSGEYAEWFEVSGTRQNLDPESGNASGSQYRFEYSYYLSEYVEFSSNEESKNVISYTGLDCDSCISKLEAAKNVERLAYGAAIMALAVAYMANDSIKNLHKKNLRKALTNLKYSAILVLVLGALAASTFVMSWPTALIEDEAGISTSMDQEPVLGCIVNTPITFLGTGSCIETIEAEKGTADRVSARVTPISWTPGIGFFVVLLGSVLTGGGTLYILGNIDEEWQGILKKQDLIERQQKIQNGEIEKNKDLLHEFEDTEEKLRNAERKIQDVKTTAESIDYEGIDDLNMELDRLTALNQSVETLNNSLESKLKTARIATSEVEKRSRMAEKELNDDVAAKTNLEGEIESLRGKHENDMRLSDRMTREIGSLRNMSEDAEEKAIEAEKKLKIEKPETISALESYDSVKASYDKTVEEKNNLEKEIMDYEQHTLESNEREKAAKAERNEAAQRRKELDREVKLMEKNKKRINDKFTTLATNLEKAKKDLAAAREKAAVTLSELDLERETIIELQQEAETHRAKEGEIIGLTDSLKELQEQVTNQKTSNDGIQNELKDETNRKKKTQTDLNTLERASKQVSKVMESLKMQFDEAKTELNISMDERNQAERLLETEKTEHEKLKEDLEFLQGTTIGSEEDTERKIKAMEIETPKNQEEAREMKEESDVLSSLNSDLSEKIKDARIESVQKAANETLPETNTSEAPGATIGSSIIVKNLTKETEHNFELVNPDQVDPKNGKIPLTNPIGKALEGAKEGDEIKVGPNLFKVLELK